MRVLIQNRSGNVQQLQAMEARVGQGVRVVTVVLAEMVEIVDVLLSRLKTAIEMEFKYLRKPGEQEPVEFPVEEDGVERVVNRALIPDVFAQPSQVRAGPMEQMAIQVCRGNRESLKVTA